MTVFEHNPRYRVFSKAQHPYNHSLYEFSFVHPAIPGVTNLGAAMDYLFAVLYPQSQPSVATPADLPAAGNTIGDFRAVQDDGDGHAAGYQWQKREGDVAAKWYKIYDYDWGQDDILQGFYEKTLDMYVFRDGYQQLDSAGAPITGDLAGQHIYGGRLANSNLTLFANSGDGTGPSTGYVQFGDHARPLQNSSWDLGSTAYRFRKLWADAATTGTLTLGSGSITDSSGAISFDNENLSTTGTITVGNMVLATGSLTNTSGAISFADENLTTTGTLASGTHTIGTLVLAAASITNSSGSISFGSTNLSTTGTLAAGATTATRLDVDNVRIDGSLVSATNANGDLALAANGTGFVDVQSALKSLGQTVTGVVGITGQLNADNLRLDGNVLSATDANGSIALQPNGTGVVTASTSVRPTTDATLDLGAAATRWGRLYAATAISDGTNEISIANLLTFRAVGTLADGYALFWSVSLGRWVASAPDSEIDHGTLSGLADDDHTQYMLLAGRASGQVLRGGTAASETLILESTANAAKGRVLTRDTLAAATDAAYSAGTWSSGADLGASGLRFRHVYTAGEHFGFRLENLGADPSTNSQAPGRLFWQTATKYVGVDTGTAIQRLSQYRFESDTSWNGSDVTKDVDVSASIPDARKAIWQLKNNGNDYEDMLVSLKATSVSNVRITVNVALPAGSYRLVGIQ